MEFDAPEEAMTDHDLDWIRSARLTRKDEKIGREALTEGEAR